MELKSFTGPEARQYFKELATLRIKVFSEYPYLYKGLLENEKEYLETYFSCPDALVILCFDENRVIGASTAIPLRDEESAMKAPFLRADFDLKQVFYFGESILEKPYRGQGIGKKFFEKRMDHARSFPEIKYLSFCAINRTGVTVPKDYFSPEPIWKKYGFHKEEKLVGEYAWKDIGEDKETTKVMEYWLTSIN